MVNSLPATNPTKFNTIQFVWDRLLEIRSLTFIANSLNGNTGWCGMGEGDVRVKPIDSHTILLHEQGIWESETNKKFAFNNSYRWTQKETTNFIRLEHLRFGIDRPVLLF